MMGRRKMNPYDKHYYYYTQCVCGYSRAAASDASIPTKRKMNLQKGGASAKKEIRHIRSIKTGSLCEYLNIRRPAERRPAK
jgi:hypothetical protein